MFKNVAGQSVTLLAIDSATGKEKTGDAANQLFYVSKDDGAVTAIASNSGVPTEIDATNAKGLGKIALAQAETNADKLLFSGKSSTAGIVIVPATIYTAPASFTSFVTPAGATVAAVTAAVTLPAIPANWITAAGINAAALNGKGDWLTGDSAGVTTLLSRIGGAITIASGGVLVHTVDTGAIVAGSFAAAAITSTVAPNLDASVSSRSTYAGADTSGTTTLLARVPGTVQPQTGDSYARLGTPVNASISADLAEIEADVDGISLAGVASTILQDTTAADFLVANSAGAYLKAAGGAADPLTNLLGVYASGTAGGALQKLLQSIINVTSPIMSGGKVTVIQGDDYKAVDNRALPFLVPASVWGDYTSAALSFVALYSDGSKIGPLAGSIINANTETQTILIPVLAANTTGLHISTNEADTYDYAVRVTKGGDSITPWKGPLVLDRNLFA